jgi:hypothetical protein
VLGRRRELPAGSADHAGPGARLGIGAAVLADSWSWAGLIFRPGRVRGDHRLGRRDGRARTVLLAVLALAVVPGR